MSKFRIKYMLVTALTLCYCLHSAGQSNPNEKKLQQIEGMINNDELGAADSVLITILNGDPTYGDAWDLLADVRLKSYNSDKNVSGLNGLFKGNISITTKDEKGNEVKGNDNDSLVQKLTMLLNKLDPEKIAFSKLMYAIRKSTLLTRDAYKCSFYARRLNLDINVDSNVNTRALDYFKEAEAAFSDKDFGKARSLYKRAIEEQPNFYKASMYLGDCDYFTKNYPQAITSFKDARNKFPTLMEPRKYLTDAYYKAGLYDKAYEEAVASLIIYPDFSMIKRVEDAAYLYNKKVNIGWTPRAVFPNKVIDTSADDLNTYKDPEADKAQPKDPWTWYTAAYKKILPYCNANGIIIKENPYTTSKYMEVYSWEEMLKNSKDPVLDEARKMQQQGYLDCYVMVSCFHYDFYDQYHDFATNNKDRIIAYYNAFTKYR